MNRIGAGRAYSPASISGPRRNTNPMADRAFYVTIPTSRCAIQTK
jgi:hypothetical protein